MKFVVQGILSMNTFVFTSRAYVNTVKIIFKLIYYLLKSVYFITSYFLKYNFSNVTEKCYFALVRVHYGNGNISITCVLLNLNTVYLY